MKACSQRLAARSCLCCTLTPNLPPTYIQVQVFPKALWLSLESQAEFVSFDFMTYLLFSYKNILKYLPLSEFIQSMKMYQVYPLD